MDLMLELQAKIKQLEKAVQDLRTNGTELAKAERDYKVLLRQECMKLRDEGTPIGMIDKVCYGIPSVAEARYKRDVAKITYDANQDFINSIKLQLRLIESQISREYEG